MNNLCFLDTETTSLRHDRRAWEVAAIVRDESGKEDEHSWFVDIGDLDLGNADLMSLNIGKFFQRHPFGIGDVVRSRPEFSVLQDVEELTRGATIIGAVPWFDTDVLGQRMRAHGICSSWHYHLHCVETLALGYLAGQGRPIPTLPIRSDELSRLVGVEPPVEAERHTALGDARWVRDIWDRVNGK